MTKLHLDFETRSTIDLKKRGLAVYAADPTTQILMMGYAFDDEEVQIWNPKDLMPPRIREHVKKGGEVWVHNFGFEYAIWNEKLAYLEPLEWEQGVCTLAMCYAMSLPGSLDNAAAALGLKIRKDSAGHRLMLQLSKPKEVNEDGNVWYEDAEKLNRLAQYCKIDVEVERELGKRLLRLSGSERRVWQMDQAINQRGIPVDVSSIEKAIAIVDAEKERLDSEMREVTGNYVGACTNVGQLKDFFEFQGHPVEGVGKSDLLNLLSSSKNIHPLVKRAAELRQEAGKSSTSKLEAMRNRASHDGRCRGTLQYHGASTGRWCLPEDTEVLTEKGWVVFPDWDDRSPIAQWNLKGQIRFLDAKKVEFPSRVDSLIEAKHRGFFLRMTANHKMPSFSSRGIFRTLRATEAYKHSQTVPVAGLLQGVFESELKTRVLVMIQADGHYTKDISKGLYLRLKFKRTRKIIRCRELLTRSGIRFTEKVQGDGATIFSLLLKRCPDWITEFKDKTFIFGVHNFDPDIFLEELALWDGHKPKGVESFEYVTINKTNADFAQTMAHLGGMAARIKVKKRKGWSDAYRVYLRPTSKATIRGSNWKKVHEYGQKVYCAETETGFFLVRYRGFISVTGNSGRGIQIQNFKRSIYGTEDTDKIFDLLHGESPSDALGLFFGPPLDVISSVLRSFICASPHHTLLWCDFSSIEARVIAWLAGEEKVLQAFREGKDIYIVAAARIFRVPIESITRDDPRRQIGKIAVLALGFGGGKKAFAAMAKNYGVEVSEEEAEKIKIAWREAHPKIVEFWRCLEASAMAAVLNSGTECPVGRDGKITFKKSGSFLFCKLPSGRLVTYPYPKLEPVETPWGEMKDALTYMAVDSVSGKWERQKSYGGLLAENVTQAVARDLLSEALLRLEQRHYTTVFHVHDEIVCEEEIGQRSVEEMESIVKEVPPWATGLPIEVKAEEGRRYSK